MKNRNIWIYWHDLNSVPDYIKICGETIEKNKGKFKVIFLSEDSIRKFIDVPDITKTFLHHCQRTDYYRIKLLEKYGGVWIDYDTVLLKNLNFITKEIDEGKFIQGLSNNNGLIGCSCNNEIINNVSKQIDLYIEKIIIELPHPQGGPSSR